VAKARCAGGPSIISRNYANFSTDWVTRWEKEFRQWTYFKGGLQKGTVIVLKALKILTAQKEIIQDKLCFH
jgi:hypothetical protein